MRKRARQVLVTSKLSQFCTSNSSPFHYDIKKKKICAHLLMIFYTRKYQYWLACLVQKSMDHMLLHKVSCTFLLFASDTATLLSVQI